MKRAALLALLLLAQPAEARIRYLSTLGNDTTGTGQSSGAAWRTFTKAFNNLSNHDTLLLAQSAGVHSSGAYGTGIIPDVNWKALPNITIIGDSAKPNTTVVPSVNINAGSANRVHTGWALIGIRVNGNVDVQESQGISNADADGFIMRHCIVQRNLSTKDVDANFYNVRVGLNADTSTSRTSLISSGEPQHIIADRLYLYGQPTSATDYADPAIQIRTINTQLYWTRLEMTNSLLRIYGPTTWHCEKPTFFSGWNDCAVTDTKFEMVDSTGGDSLAQGLLWRDNLERNTMLRDTMIVRTVRAGKGAASIRLTSPGSNEYSYNAGGNNVWRHCWFQSNSPSVMAVGGTIGYDWQIQPGDSFYYNTVVCSTATTRAGFSINNVLGAGYVGNNTFYNRGTGGAFMVNEDGDQCNFMNGKLTVENNIFYSRSTAQTSADYAMVAKWANVSRVSDNYDSNYNLYAHYGNANGGRSLDIAPCGSTLALFKPDSARAVYGIDANSRHGSPRFTDSSFANFNPTLLAGSAAINAGRNGVTIGSREYTNPRPDEVSDLVTSAAASSAVILSWTATGEDSLTGTAASYVVRYSTSYISDFDLATDVTGEPTPGVPGTLESFTVTQLAPGTLYYFAVRVVDGAGQQSAVSNIASRFTPSSGPGFAEP